MASTAAEVASRELESAFPKEKDTTLRLPLLNGKNYLIWAETFELYFMEVDLWEVITIPYGTNLSPTQMRKNTRAYLLILTNVHESIQPFVKHGAQKNASRAWKILKDKYQGSSAVHANVLEARLEGLKYDKEKGISGLFSEGQKILNDLEAIGEPIREAKVVLTLLKALPDTFDIEKRIIKNDSNISMALAEEKLLIAEMDLKKKFEGETALVAVNKRPKGPKCWNCRKYGHKRHECKEPPKDDNVREEKVREQPAYARGNWAAAPSAIVVPRTRAIEEIPF
jgi:hypothetical protein